MTFGWNENVQIDFDLRASPVHWVNSILTLADDESVGLIAKHLVSAVLEIRFKAQPSSASVRHSKPTSTNALTVGSLNYYVTSAPSAAVIRDCKQSLSIGRKPILLVPNTQIGRAVELAKKARTVRRISIFGIEDYIAFDIITMSCEAQVKPVEIFKGILRKVQLRVSYERN